MATAIHTTQQLSVQSDSQTLLELKYHSDQYLTQNWTTKKITNLTADHLKKHEVTVSFFNGDNQETTKSTTLSYNGSKWKLTLTYQPWYSRNSSIVSACLKFFNSKLNESSSELLIATLNGKTITTILEKGVNLNLRSRGNLSQKISRTVKYSDCLRTPRNCCHTPNHEISHPYYCKRYPSQFNLCTEIINNYGLTPLHFAVFLSSTENITQLINYGSCVDVIDQKGLPPLFYAVHHHNHNAVVELLKHAPKLHHEQYAVLRDAMRYGTVETAKAILDYIEKMHDDSSKESLIEEALKHVVLGGEKLKVNVFLTKFPKQWLIINKKSALLTVLTESSVSKKLRIEVFFELMDHSIKVERWGDDYGRLITSGDTHHKALSKIFNRFEFPQIQIDEFFERFDRVHSNYRDTHPDKFGDQSQSCFNKRFTSRQSADQDLFMESFGDVTEAESNVESPEFGEFVLLEQPKKPNDLET